MMIAFQNMFNQVGQVKRMDEIIMDLTYYDVALITFTDIKNIIRFKSKIEVYINNENGCHISII